MRLFVAIDFSDDIKDRLSEAIEEIRGSASRGTFSRRENLHLTLVFLGEVRPNDVIAITKALGRIDGESFEMHIGGLGRFARPGGDICWAGVELCRELKVLQHKISDEIAGAGFEFDRRAYHPHLTLGRQVVLKDSAIRGVAAAGQSAAGQTAVNRDVLVAKWYEDPQNQGIIPDMSMYVEKVSLMQSERIGGQMVYTKIFKKDLR